MQLAFLKLGKALPPQPIIQLGRWTWTSIWQIMMSQLAPQDQSGAYRRPESAFRQWLGEDPYLPAAGRYQLIVGMSCPWAHRTLIVRALKGLEAALPAVVVTPAPEQGGWVFEQPLLGCRSLAQFYQQAQPGYSGRSTVPVLWDTETQTIVNNESGDIIVMLNSALNPCAQRPDLDLYPQELQPAIDRWNEQIYHAINNGVYRCGFAQTQAAYETACQQLFDTLDQIEQTLAGQAYLCGDCLTLADVRLFTTLIRFDVVYHSLFKCSYRRIRDYIYLSRHLRQLYHLPGVAATCDLDKVRQDYYSNLFPLNPGGIIPLATDMSWLT
jgi:putative glutathione S-transferase